MISDTIWSLTDVEFYKLCRRLRAYRVVDTTANRDEIIKRLVNDGNSTETIAKLTGYTVRHVERIRHRLGISAPSHKKQTNLA